MDVLSTSSDIRVHNYMRVSATALVFYDHILTFSDEFLYIWPQPKKVNSIAFLFNRYYTLLTNLVVITLMFVSLSEHSCKQWIHVREILVVFAQAVISALLFWRTWAMYSQSRRILILLSSVSSVGFVLIMWVTSQVSLSVEVDFGCHEVLSTRDAIYTAGAWEALLFYDCLIFTLTVVRTYKDITPFRRHSNWFSQSYLPLFNLLLRDGSMYFAAMAFTNLANILTLYFANPVLRPALTTAATSISVILVSQLILNLQKCYDQVDAEMDQTDMWMGNLRAIR